MKLRARRLVGALLPLLVTPILHPQTALYAQHKGEFRLVRRVVRSTPYVDMGGGKLEAANGSRFILKNVPEFLPVYVSIRHLDVKTQAIELMGDGAEINHEFDFKADFESPYALENVFVVLDMNAEQAGKTLFMREIGNLEPRGIRPVDLAIPLSAGLGSGHYQLHLYSNGAEVFQSELPFAFIEAKLDQMVQRRMAGVVNALPKPFIGPTPEYPPKLRRNNVAGEAVIRLTISPTGQVLNPEVQSATDPEFGASALEAARQWRFLPRMVSGAPVSTKVNMPFVFGSAPKPAAAGAK